MIIYIIAAALILLNMAGLILTVLDKHKARKRKWRIPEKVFFLMALLGAGPGIYTGMLLFRHKTRHWYFMLGIPGIVIAQAAAVYLVLYG